MASWAFTFSGDSGSGGSRRSFISNGWQDLHSSSAIQGHNFNNGQIQSCTASKIAETFRKDRKGTVDDRYSWVMLSDSSDNSWVDSCNDRPSQLFMTKCNDLRLELQPHWSVYHFSKESINVRVSPLWPLTSRRTSPTLTCRENDGKHSVLEFDDMNHNKTNMKPQFSQQLSLTTWRFSRLKTWMLPVYSPTLFHTTHGCMSHLAVRISLIPFLNQSRLHFENEDFSIFLVHPQPQPLAHRSVHRDHVPGSCRSPMFPMVPLMILSFAG